MKLDDIMCPSCGWFDLVYSSSEPVIVEQTYKNTEIDITDLNDVMVDEPGDVLSEDMEIDREGDFNSQVYCDRCRSNIDLDVVFDNELFITALYSAFLMKNGMVRQMSDKRINKIHGMIKVIYGG